MSILLAAGIAPAYAQFQSGGVDKAGSWHVGEGLKQGDYFYYSMCYVDYKECVNFEMELWIKGDVQSGSETKWLAEAVVYDGNKVVKGEIELGKIAPEPTGGSSELGVYRGAFKSSVVWLSAFATADTGTSGKGPKEFAAKSWGKIGNIGGEQVIPMALETVRTQSGTWDTVLVGWKTGGVTSKVWIVDEFPFPVKAKTFTHVSEGIAPVEYEFELVKYEENVQQSPFADVEPTGQEFVGRGCDTGIGKETTIKRSTANFDYQIYAFYGPAEPIQGCPMEWLIKFISKYDDTEFLNQVHFDFLVLEDDRSIKRSIAKEEGRQFLYSPSGQYELDMIVKENPGDVTYTILVYGLAPENWVPDAKPDYLEIPVLVLPSDSGYVQPTPPVSAPTPPVVRPAEQTAVPDWIKDTTKLWINGDIDDATFVNGIQFLINKGIIVIPPTAQGSSDSAEIPSWIKDTAKLWTDGDIDDATFVNGIQFLIKEGIISLS
ncbi:MAG: peptidase [Nitrosopumilus sp. H8]|nr:MAG: peptidase [Nitrosopumilus sp. H8]